MTHKYERRVPPNTWIVVCDRTRARIFNSIWPHEKVWDEVGDLVHPEAREHERDTISDGPGSFAETAGGHHAGDPQTDFRHRTAEAFARQVVDHLEQHRQRDDFGEVVIAAPSVFLGVLRETYPAPLAKLVRREIDKEYVQLTPRELQERLNELGVFKSAED
jgi:protein required for attachment to host cells